MMKKNGSYNGDDPDRPRWTMETALVKIYDYFDEKGNYLTSTLRGRRPDGSKTFLIGRRRKPDEIAMLRADDPEQAYQFPGTESYLKGKGDRPWVLYNLPQLIAAPADQTVFVCEGEKDADTLTNLALLATTCPNGAEKWLPEYSAVLVGRHVVLLPDNDVRGHRHARQVLSSVHPVAASVRIAELEGAKDVTEWIEAGNTKDELQRLVNDAAFATPDTWIGQDAIVLRKGKSPEIVDQIAHHLRGARVSIYQRGGELVRPLRGAPAPDNGVARRADDALVLRPLNARWLAEQSERHIAFKRPKIVTTIDANGNAAKILGYAAADLPLKYPEAYLARGEWDEPVLRAVISAPTLLADGTILQKPGYDPGSGLLLDFDRAVFPPVPENPTQEDAMSALKLFEHLLAGFPFVDDAARAVAISAMLTAVIRPSLHTAPLHVFDAPVAGTGKSMVATMAGVLATGHRPAMMSQGKSEEEDEKRLSTVMMEGDPVIILDNCERPVGGDFLCSALTELMVQARILGKSERTILPTTALIMATGNNMVIAGDMVRRAVICRMDAREERPELRKFEFNPVAELVARRPQLVVEALTALRAYKLANSPVTLTPMGSFEDWAWVRGTLVWCGYADPADTREALFSAEPQRAELAGVLNVWADVVGDRKIDVAEIGGAEYSQRLYKLREMLISVTGTHNWNARSSGRWLLKHVDQHLAGMVLRKVSAHGNRVAKYQLEGVSQIDEKRM